MKRLRYSRRAEADLEAISDYTLEKWGGDQAVVYVRQLGACAELVFENPGIARAAQDHESSSLRVKCS